jgi:intron-binding protein aquarius
MPLYPTEEIIWDENIVPTDFYSGDGLYAFYFLLFIFLMHQINHSKANFTLISYQKKKEI